LQGKSRILKKTMDLMGQKLPRRKEQKPGEKDKQSKI